MASEGTEQQTELIRQSIENMRATVARSHMLWLCVARMILAVLESDRTPGQMAEELKRLAGRKKRGEAVSVENFRTAARQLRAGKPVQVF